MIPALVLLQIVCVVTGGVTTGVGFTVTITLSDGPVQPRDVGVIT